MGAGLSECASASSDAAVKKNNRNTHACTYVQTHRYAQASKCHYRVLTQNLIGAALPKN